MQVIIFMQLPEGSVSRNVRNAIVAKSGSPKCRQLEGRYNYMIYSGPFRETVSPQVHDKDSLPALAKMKVDPA